MPPARKPDDVRSYWRAVVKARLDSGDLVGNPQSSSGTSKVTKIKDGKKGAIGVVQPMSKQEAASEDEEVDDVDDFFE